MRKVLKYGAIVLGAIVVAALIAGALVFAMFRHFYPAPPQADYARPKDGLEAQ